MRMFSHALLVAIVLVVKMSYVTSWWQPKPEETWQWQLQGTIDTTKPASMFDIDLFDSPQSVIDNLHAKGKIVICYFSAGSYEKKRPDSSQFPEILKSKKMDGWDEMWLDISQMQPGGALQTIMKARMDLAVQKGCDGVEPDNVDAWSNDVYSVRSVSQGGTRVYGSKITGAIQLTYNKFLATYAHSVGLSVGLKNDVDQIPQLVASFDWALNEQCNQFSECDNYEPFLSANKAVFGVEYKEYVKSKSFCTDMNDAHMSWLYKTKALLADPFDPCAPDWPTGPQCGDNVCSQGENFTSCATDCPGTVQSRRPGNIRPHHRGN